MSSRTKSQKRNVCKRGGVHIQSDNSIIITNKKAPEGAF